jgi:DNA-binding NarL/FixJ family response regulator
VRVLVADDHPLFRYGIVSLLQAASFVVVGQVGNGQTAVAAALRLLPDLLLDIAMPVISELQALRLIKGELPETPFLILTVSDEDADLIAAIKSGASGYPEGPQDRRAIRDAER